MDRFLIRLSLGYPDEETELGILRSHRTSVPLNAVRQVTTPAEVLKLREEVKAVHIEEAMERYIIELVKRTRVHAGVRLPASPRAGLALVRMSQAFAKLGNRDYVTPDDVQSVFLPVMAHRVFAADAGEGVSEGILEEIRKQVKIPA